MSNSSSSSGGGVGLLGLLTIAFVVLKLIGKITWSWWWVLAPTWIPFALAIPLSVLFLYLAYRKTKSTARRATPRDRGISDVGIMVLIGIGVVILIIGIYAIWTATADVRGRAAVHNKIHGNADYRIASYNHFFDLCAGVQSREAAIRNAQEEAKTASQARREQLQAVVTANRNERADLINQYNADASKFGTEGQFRASNLPYTLDLNSEETQCTA